MDKRNISKNSKLYTNYLEYKVGGNRACNLISCYTYMMNKVLLSIVLSLSIFHTNQASGESFTIPISDQCLEFHAKLIDALSSSQCIDLEFRKFDIKLESHPTISQFIVVKDKVESSGEDELTHCSNAESVSHMLVKRCQAISASTVERTEDLKADLDTLSGIIKRRINSGKTKLGSIVVTDKELKLVEDGY